MFDVPHMGEHEGLRRCNSRAPYRPLGTLRTFALGVLILGNLRTDRSQGARLAFTNPLDAIQLARLACKRKMPRHETKGTGVLPSGSLWGLAH